MWNSSSSDCLITVWVQKGKIAFENLCISFILAMTKVFNRNVAQETSDYFLTKCYASKFVSTIYLLFKHVIVNLSFNSGLDQNLKIPDFFKPFQ